ncbi:import inner membrane translocase subunit tim13 [Aspergillus sclerotioniger CBS 115572]|uniref:Mitochondrial import inner membrane translocase subunit n=1 Tax=Aspergillus sclerotioniger CBS 115572 TaxID=1450535 RepID=A0A317WSK9_9EURO|nr:import inner membrane translocase subunit tim13 [Aspergillus sclerotioniger CBS 115572]PWY89386.1 import inner membrane translocase subunit tim13 [Aspergillus sclerotioniger CBS 115572]
MSFFGSGSGSDPSSKEVKDALVKQVQAESAMANARSLITKVNENCFSKCIPTPGASLSAGEQTCLTDCMEKYIAFWNEVSRTHHNRMGLESKRLSL